MSLMDDYSPPHDRVRDHGSPVMGGPGHSNRNMQARLRAAVLELLAINQSDHVKL